MNGIVRAKK